MSWCLVVTSAIFYLISMLLIIVIGYSRTQNSVCFPTLDDSSRGKSKSILAKSLNSGLLGAHTKICPEKRGFLRGEPCRGDCGSTRGCRTETASLCRMKCFDNPACEAWTFHSRQKQCFHMGGGQVTCSYSLNSVWGLACRVTGQGQSHANPFVIHILCRLPGIFNYSKLE